MQNSATLKRHARLVDLMADTQGVDFDQGMMAGLMQPHDLHEAVLACTGCANTDACTHWLNTNDRAAATPDYCRNAEFFERLKLGTAG